MEDMMKITLELNIEEVNIVLRSLGKHPFDEVVALIQKIKGQGDAQIAEAQQTDSKPTPN